VYFYDYDKINKKHKGIAMIKFSSHSDATHFFKTKLNSPIKNFKIKIFISKQNILDNIEYEK